jgi:ferrochelatase
VSGWHRHPSYLQVRVKAIADLLARNSLDLTDPGTRLVFSAHGTPLRYLENGSRYGEYVEGFCAAVARELAAPSYTIGYQNHSNRPGVKWTQPGIEEVIDTIEAERVVVDPVSFMHEQSETLAELDDELKERAEERGLGFFRVPIPHVDRGFIGLLADLAEHAAGVNQAGNPVSLSPCRCKPTPGTFCTNSRS